MPRIAKSQEEGGKYLLNVKKPTGGGKKEEKKKNEGAGRKVRANMPTERNKGEGGKDRKREQRKKRKREEEEKGGGIELALSVARRRLAEVLHLQRHVGEPGTGFKEVKSPGPIVFERALKYAMPQFQL